MRALVVGGGRMGQRHVSGLAGLSDSISVVDPLPTARDACAALAGQSHFGAYATLTHIPAGARFDAVILGATAAGRLEQLQWASERTSAVLAEKPLEQSRAGVRQMLAVARKPGLRVWCNHYRRMLARYEPLRMAGGPYAIAVASGAMGIGCNGIHWIDFALHLAGQDSGRLLFGEVEETAIGSGRGPQYRDYGGRGLFAFPDGSRLYVSSSAASSAPTMMSIISPTAHWIVDQQMDRALVHQRAATVRHPNYLYGMGYEVAETSGLEEVNLPALTRAFASALSGSTEPPQPRIETVAPAYELLFDLLETSGRTAFDFT